MHRREDVLSVSMAALALSCPLVLLALSLISSMGETKAKKREKIRERFQFVCFFLGYNPSRSSICAQSYVI